MLRQAPLATANSVSFSIVFSFLAYSVKLGCTFTCKSKPSNSSTVKTFPCKIERNLTLLNNLRELQQRRRRRQRKLQKSNRFLNWKGNNFASTVHFFATFLLSRPKTSKWDFRMRRFLKDVNARRQLFLNLGAVLKKSTLGKFTYIWLLKPVGINATKFEERPLRDLPQGVISLIVLPKSLRVLLSCATYGFRYSNSTGSTKFNRYEKKKTKCKKTSSCIFPLPSPLSSLKFPFNGSQRIQDKHQVTDQIGR